jgi:F-type H+-transporting ATPase subunit delta
VEALLASADKSGDLGEVETNCSASPGRLRSAALSNALSDPIAPAGQRASLARELPPARPVR